MARVTDEGIEKQLASPEFIVNPYPTYRSLREKDPIYYSNSWGVWVFTRYDDVVKILRDPQHFSNAGRFSALLDQLPASIQNEVIPLRQHYAAGLIQCDPPDHTRLRGLIRDAFATRVINNLRPRVQSVVDELIDQFEQGGEFDLIRDFAY